MSQCDFICTQERLGETVRIHLAGSLTAAAILALTDSLREARESQPKSIELDLQNLTRMDSAGYAFLKAHHALNHAEPVPVHICGLSAACVERMALPEMDHKVLCGWMTPGRLNSTGDPESEPARGECVKEDPEGAGPWLLVVDDEELVRNYLEAYLKRKGYEVACACNEDEALSHLAAQAGIRLALVDYRLGSGNGLALVDKLAALKPGLKVILMSGLSDEDVAVEGRPAIVRRLQKPLYGEALERTVREALEA